MIHVTDDGDIRMREQVEKLDPFQSSNPLWMDSPIPAMEKWNGHHYTPLPSSCLTREQQIQKDREKIMAVKFVNEQEAPQRLHGRGAISSSQEYIDALNAVRQIPAGKAIVVTLESKELLAKEKPELAFAYSVRRYLAENNVAATAYQSGKHEVVIRRSAVGAAPKKRNGK